MQRNDIQVAVAETIRSNLPPGFTLRGAAWISEGKLLTGRVPSFTYKAYIFRGKTFIARLMMQDSVIRVQLAARKKSRVKGDPLKRILKVDLVDPDSMQKLEEWARMLIHAK